MMTRYLSVPIGIILTLCFITDNLPACGPTTHMEIVERAPDDVDPGNYPDLVEVVTGRTWERDCGSVFPDWGYGMYYVYFDEFYRTLSYVAHDYTTPSFRQACIDYVNENYTYPFNGYQETTVSFMLGIVGHQEADYDWHDNFIPVASMEDNTNEVIIEGTCDLFVNYEWGEKWDFVKAFCPVNVILEVYKDVGYEVDRDTFIEGLVLMRVGIIADKAIGYFTYLAATLLVPWTHENYSDYPAGGLDDCAVKAAAGWEEMWDGFLGAAGREIPDRHARPPREATDSPHGELIYGTAARLLFEGAVSVEVAEDGRGGVEIGTPEIVDRDLFRKIIAETAASLH